MFDNIHILYILSKYKLGFISKKELIIGFREYIINRGQIFIKIIQLFLMNQYKWGGTFTNDEFEELNKILDNVYLDIPESDFNIGCGSVAYVCYNKSDNSKVIKKLIPGIEEKIEESFDNFSSMIKMSRLFNYDIINIDELYIYKKYMLEQTNMIKEADSMKKMKQVFKFNKYINIPNIFFYNNEMIEMEFKKGEKIDDFLKKYPDRKKECCKLLEEALKSMLDSKFIHGDLHPGNLLFYIKNNEVKLNMIDFGLVLELTKKQHIIFYNFLFKNNTDNNIKYIYEMSSKTIFFSDFYKICNLDKNINIFNNNSISIDGHYIIKFLKDNNITINIKYINFLITFYSLRSRLK